MLVLFNTEEVLRAKEKEITNWKDNKGYEEVEDVGQGALSVRWVVTEKVVDGQTVVKARLVARGFEEETGNLRKDSPTCSKEAVHLALSVAATCGWVCHSLDVKAAYLQGYQIDRDVYLRPPPEFNDGSLWKLKKTVYGLCDAARHWYLRVRSQLLDLGTIASSLEPALFSWRCGQSLEGVICVYVDDLFWAGTNGFKEQVIDRLCQIFRMGGSESKAFKYVGLNIVSYGDGSVTLDQNQYAATLTPISVSKQKATVKSYELSESERSEYRAVLGQLNWIATHTRPDIAFEVCELSGACSKATIADLLRLNKVIDRVKNDAAPLQHNFHIDNTNKLLLQSTPTLPSLPTTVSLDMVGEGCALIQAVLRYNVPEDQATEAFSLSVETGTRHDPLCLTKSIKVCASYQLPDNTSNMAVVEVNLVSGYIPSKTDLKRIVGYGTGLIKRYEVDGSLVTFYVDEFTRREICLEFGMTRHVDVEHVKPGTVKVYDYYQPEYFTTQVSVVYNIVVMSMTTTNLNTSLHRASQLAALTRHPNFTSFGENDDYLTLAPSPTFLAKNERYLLYDVQQQECVALGTTPSS
ncbi:hypothetical protein Pmani_002341 [Petrolisthes manimaculis]|uniref:Alpha-macroglobulin receptor-binding domain-containing protein n=1 Tax=Petrolisthes manimaculis TaxID=1843537 RepID=A0AAE1UNK2_9EUCA|nr:hypothetical protein Pmani_002341 [Petrolisthes manimaculis]